EREAVGLGREDLERAPVPLAAPTGVAGGDRPEQERIRGGPAPDRRGLSLPEYLDDAGFDAGDLEPRSGFLHGDCRRRDVLAAVGGQLPLLRARNAQTRG